jgi:hypothetical protein
VLADWLRCWQVPAVVMEAAGGYWKEAPPSIIQPTRWLV